MSPLIKSGDNYLVIPYCSDILKKDPNVKTKIVRSNIKQIKAFVKFLYDEGSAHLDFHPGNLLYTEADGLKVIDFEFLQKYEVKPESFKDSFDLINMTHGFKGDLPRNRATHNNLWKKACGYSLQEIAS